MYAPHRHSRPRAFGTEPDFELSKPVNLKRSLSAALAAALLVTIAPATAMADDTPTPAPAETAAPLDVAAQPDDASADSDADGDTGLVPNSVTPLAVRLSGDTLTLHGTVRLIGDSEDADGNPLYVLEVLDGGLVAVAGDLAENAVGIPGDFTFDATDHVIAALNAPVADSEMFGPDNDIPTGSLPAEMIGLSDLASDVGALVPVGFAPLSTSSDIAAGNTSAALTTAAVFGSSRKHAKKATHKVWVVPASPNYASASADQSTANIKADVAAASRYWSKQSHGKITFKVQSIYPHRSLPNTVDDLCLTSQFPAVMNWAYQYAHYQGFSYSANKHMVVVYPDGLCDALGRGRVGSNPNNWGYLWTTGTIAPMAKQTLAHELGHNMSFGHANQMTCTSAATRAVAYCGTSPNEYYDIFDTMGFGVPGFQGGSYSSPNAIDAGLWTSKDYYTAPTGVHSYTINVVSSETGRRAVAVKDPADGSVFYVEARSLTGRDSGANTGGYLTAFYMAQGVRIMQIKPASGYTTQVIPRDSTHYYFTAGDSFTSPKGGVTVSVTATSSTQATVQVTARPVISRGTVSIVGTPQYGNALTAQLAGWTTFLPDSLDAAIQWRRNGKNIPGATSSTYTPTKADIGKRLSVRTTVKVNGKPEYGSVSAMDTAATKVVALPITAYPVTITGTTKVGETLTANSTPWTPGIAATPAQTITMSYTWYRGKRAIRGAHASTYTLTAKDKGKTIKVKITGTSTGYITKAVRSAATAKVGAGVIEGSPVVGVTLSAGKLTAAPAGVTTPGVKYSYKWYSGTRAIKHATHATYTLKGKDSGKAIKVRVAITKAGYTTVVVYSTPTIFS